MVHARRRRHSLVHMIQHYVAIDAVGTSAMRSQGRGVLHVMQEHLVPLSLRGIPKTRRGFGRWLDSQTEAALVALEGLAPERPWGTARKALNLFLRGCLYNHYLRKNYGLARTEPWLEIPLDGVVARALKKLAGRGKLPVWHGLKRLRPEQSARFQEFAAKHARTVGLPARVFLDHDLWIANR
jgi:hypothetical protein